jgi:predicted O-methyltransferase YrrM
MSNDLMHLLGQIQAALSVRHLLPSAILSADDDRSGPTRELMDLGLRAVRAAQDIDLSDVSGRIQKPPLYPDVWPGEHYKLLAGLVQTMQPKCIVEIGTAEGMSVLALKKFLPASSKVVTFDIVPWAHYSDSVLRAEDFADGGLTQIVADLTDINVVHQQAGLLRQADIVFMDAAKDGRMESVFMNNFTTVGLKEKALFVFDDIRLIQMVPLWRQLVFPKMDLTSFGHWSGTGLAFWSQSRPWSG